VNFRCDNLSIKRIVQESEDGLNFKKIEAISAVIYLGTPSYSFFDTIKLIDDQLSLTSKTSIDYRARVEISNLSLKSL